MGKIYSVKADARIENLMAAQAKKVRAEAQAVAKSRQEAIDSYAWSLQKRFRNAQIELEKAIEAEADLDRAFVELAEARAEVKAWKATIKAQVVSCFKNVRHDDYVTEAFWADCYSSEELYQDYSVVDSDSDEEDEKDFTFTFDSEVRKLRKQVNSEKNHYKANLRSQLEEEILAIEKWRQEHPELFNSTQDRKVSVIVQAIKAERACNRAEMADACMKMKAIKAEEAAVSKTAFDNELDKLAKELMAF